MNNPPQEDAPVGVICPGLWTVQVRWWKRHTPRLGEKTCTECGQAWPCHSWLCWDGQIGDAWEASKRFQRTEAEAATVAAPVTTRTRAATRTGTRTPRPRSEDPARTLSAA
ncbi:hypothetical protein AB0I28_31915 [Phytomonospora sp. NPDC050363]|uniref:hypothetical protein n=1 Tax=Phytomonospora sp. NPDC050363 TaxID=3155642 RepID=UPI0033D3EC01